MMELGEKCLDSELWHACAGGMVQMPPVNSKVFYFPQGHAEHTLASVDFGALPRIPSMILCRVSAVKYLANQETDEVYAKIRLLPVGPNEHGFDEDGMVGRNGSESNEKPSSFSKTLTQSDANNGGGFSVPRYCAETIFPQLDYTVDPPVQNVIAKDVHGESWKFRHIYRGTPRRHLLTTGWSTFVNQKKLVAGDSIVFLRVGNGDLCVGIRRAKRVCEQPSAWNSGTAANANYGGFSAFLNGDESKVMHRSLSSGNLRERGRVRPESVVESAFLAANGQPFEIVYYPRVSTPEFFVKAASVSAAMRIQWCSGTRFKMAFETEDSSRISWFMGTIASSQVVDPITWPNSPWRLLQVTWDEPDMLQNVKSVSPWLVEIVSNMPVLHLPSFSPPMKKLCLPHHLDFTLHGHFPMPSFSGKPRGPSSPFRHLADHSSAGVQGARHTQIGVPLSDLHLNKLQQIGVFPVNVPCREPLLKFPNIISGSGMDMDMDMDGNESITCLLSMGNSNKKLGKNESVKKPLFVLFGQPILTEQQMARDVSDATRSERLDVDKRELTERCCAAELGLAIGHCEVIFESEDAGRTTIDLSVLRSYDELFQRLEHMFGVESSEMWSHVSYRDATGAVKHAGDEPFSEFVKTAKKLTVLMKPNSSTAKRKRVTGLPKAEQSIDSSNPAGPLSTFA